MPSSWSSPFYLSQYIACVGLIIDLIVFQFRDRRHILLCMLAAGVLGAIHFFLLAANTAGVISIVFCFRITAAYFYPVKWMAAVFVGGAIITSALTFAGWTSVLACLGTSTGTLASFQKDNRRMRQQFLLASGFWTAHNILVWSPIAILQEIAISSSNLLGLWRYHRKMGPLDSPPP